VQNLQPYFLETDDFKVRYRIMLALHALHNPLLIKDYVVVKGKGAFKRSELESYGNEVQRLIKEAPSQDRFPVVDFHIHPKLPDLKFFSDMREAGVTHAVILATDTDPTDVDRPEIREKLRKNFARSPMSHSVSFVNILSQIKSSLYSYTHVTNQDVADWVEDYPDKLFGFGSVNPSKNREYVEENLEEVGRLKMRGFKFLPFSQFFNPAENENMNLVCEYCLRTGAIILSHSGCGAGPFEIPEMSEDAHPGLWEPLLKRFPEVQLVLAHFGAYSELIPGIWFNEVLQLGKKYHNVYADLAAVNWLLDREEAVREIRNTIGFDRVLFATDYPLPLTSGVSLAYLVSRLKANTNLSEEEKRQVLGENATRLLGIV